MQLQTSFWEKQRGRQADLNLAEDIKTIFSSGLRLSEREPGKRRIQRGIYVGYRYFDTFSVKPLFSFG